MPKKIDYTYHTFFGTIKVYANPYNDWAQRQLVADFVDTLDGQFAFSCFCESLARRGGSLLDADTNTFIVGSLDQLDPVA